MPDFPFTNQQTVHVTHGFGTAHIPVYVEAEGYERLVEVAYGDGYFDVLFGRVMSSGLISYATGGGAGTIFVETPGSGGTVEHAGAEAFGFSSLTIARGDGAGQASVGSPGTVSPGSFQIG